MDNFMDKLARRFNAGDIIKANAAAEAKEIERMKEQKLEYDRMMQEMRRLNLKNVEVTEQVQQLIQSGIEQFEEYDGIAHTLKDNIGKENDLESEAVFSKLGEMSNTLLASCAAMGTIQESLSELDRAISQTDGTSNKNKEAVDLLGTNVNLLTADIKGIDTQLQQIKEKLEEETELSKSVERIIEAVNGISMKLNVATDNMQDYVHQENIKVYRNVQAVIQDQTREQNREISDRLDGIERQAKKTNVLMPITIITLLTVLGSLIMQLLNV